MMEKPAQPQDTEKQLRAEYDAWALRQTGPDQVFEIDEHGKVHPYDPFKAQPPAKGLEEIVLRATLEMAEDPRRRESAHAIILRACQDARAASATPSGWIALSERKPTEADGDEKGRVFWKHGRYGTYIGPWHSDMSYSHWMPIPPLPKFAQPDPDEAFEREAIRKWDERARRASDSLGEKP